MARPLGGLLLGYLGDVYGRKQALTISIFLMAFPTFAMGCLPSYEQIGYWATISLIVIRILQGMSVGGQLISSLVFTLESVPKSKWGLYGSFVWATSNFGVLLGSLVGFGVRSNFSQEQLVAYGWRIPFLCGVVVSVAGFYLKSTDHDHGNSDEGSKTTIPEGSPHPEKKANPLAIVFHRQNLRPLFASAMVPMLWSS